VELLLGGLVGALCGLLVILAFEIADAARNLRRAHAVGRAVDGLRLRWSIPRAAVVQPAELVEPLSVLALVVTMVALTVAACLRVDVEVPGRLA
jgi:hypothetical protein